MSNEPQNVRVSSHHKLKIDFDLGALPDQEDEGRPFRPRRVEVWTNINPKGSVGRITFVSGPQILKSGEIGVASRTKVWELSDGPLPAWLSQLIEDAA